MTIKRLILTVLTVFAIAKVLLSLGESFNQPQVQSRLELYQTNLVLQAAEFAPQTEEDSDLATLREAIIGTNPYETAENQYSKALSESKTTRDKLQNQVAESPSLSLTPPAQAIESSPRQQLQKEVYKVDQFIEEVELRLGLLQAQRGEIDTALQTWHQISTDSETAGKIVATADVLEGLWSRPPSVKDNAKPLIEDNLDHWFRDRALQQLYTVDQQQELLADLKATQQLTAENALLKLAVVAGIPAFFGVLGVALILFSLIQLAIKGKESLLATNYNTTWETPWDWEIVWQVLIVGFFFVGQFILPLLFSFSGFNPGVLTIRGKAIYVLISYLLMSFGGLLVLYLSIKKFLPFPQDWFRIKLWGSWVFWGIGGYFVALPLVVIVSLINQQIWQGQGGSNPILFLALQAQDKVALAIFFFTASIAAPVFEEIMFRGFLLSSLTRYFPVTGSIIISSLVFSIAHLSLSEVLPLTTLGIVLGVVYTRSRNLLAPILLHSLWNSGTLLSLFILGSQ